jgi:hypothetical protein
MSIHKIKQNEKSMLLVCNGSLKSRYIGGTEPLHSRYIGVA